MIKEFSVTNYRSIKDKQTLSFAVNNKIKNNFDDSLMVKVSDNVNLLKLGLLYGANAAGKSNILLAMDTLLKMVNKGPRDKEETIDYAPFLFGNETRKQPTELNLVFYYNEVEYEYSLSFDRAYIISEKLIFSPGGRKATIFSRSYSETDKVSKISFGAKCTLKASEKMMLKANAIPSASVLYTYQKLNVNSKELDSVVSFFRRSLMPIESPYYDLSKWSRDYNPKNRAFLVELMKRAGFQISDIEIRNNQVELTTDLLESMKYKLSETLIKSTEKQKPIETENLFFTHSTSNGMGSICIESESKGTKRFFALGSILKELIDQERFACIDELETSLHPDLVSFILNAFLMNSKQSQLLATTHLTSLMDLEYMRSDMIWFCEKKEDGSSEYYQAQDFKLHKSISLQNAYTLGKLGAVPFIGSPVLTGEDSQS